MAHLSWQTWVFTALSWQMTDICDKGPYSVLTIQWCSVFSVNNCIQVIALCRQEAHQKDQCQLTWGETLLCRCSFQPFVLLLNEWGDVVNRNTWKYPSKIRLYQQCMPQGKYDFFASNDVKLVFSPGEEERLHVCVRARLYESEQPSVMLTCCWSFPGAVCGREALKLPGKTAHSEGFEEDWRGRGAWQGAAEAHLFPIL